MHPYEVLRRPLITEKSTTLAGENKYAFEVAAAANKALIKDAVQRVFNVEVEAVNVMNVPGKLKRVGKNRGMTREWKKAIVTLKPGYNIELFEGV